MHRLAAQRFRTLMARYRSAEELIRLGAYTAGSDPEVDYMVERRDQTQALLCQMADETVDYDETIAGQRWSHHNRPSHLPFDTRVPEFDRDARPYNRLQDHYRQCTHPNESIPQRCDNAP